MKPIETELVVIGAGPGGYTAAFYAADRGKQVTLVEQAPRLGGVCLNEGCIPSKALLHTAKLLEETKQAASWGLAFPNPTIHLEKLRAWKEGVLDRLAQGIGALAQKRRVQVVSGRGHFEDVQTLRVETAEGQKFIRFQHAIVATGSKPSLPSAFDLGNRRVMTSTEALAVEEIPKKLLVVGGGYIGMELGTVYAALGSKVHLVEALDAILLGADPDLVRLVQRVAKTRFASIRLGVKVMGLATRGKQIQVKLEVAGEQREEHYNRVLVSIGRVPSCDDLGLAHAGVEQNEKGFVQVTKTGQTTQPTIYAIGDVAGGVLLAHKAAREARIAVDAICGEPSPLAPPIIPAVVFTDPELAWCGLTETDAKVRKLSVKIVRFPWGASGRALTLNRPDGVTKLVVEPETERLLGVGIAGVGAGELIGEAVLAIEMGTTVGDLAETIHPHPTLSETLMEAAETFYGTATHTFSPKPPA